MCQSSCVGAIVVCRRILIGSAKLLSSGSYERPQLIDGAYNVVEITSGHRFPLELSCCRKLVVPEARNVCGEISQQAGRGFGGPPPVLGVTVKPGCQGCRAQAFRLSPEPCGSIMYGGVICDFVNRDAAMNTVLLGHFHQPT